MDLVTTNATKANGASAPHELFALTDEQILEIEPEAQDATVSRGPWPVPREEKPGGQGQAGAEPAPNGPGNRAAAEKPNPESQVTTNSSSTEHGIPHTEHAPEPPPWLAEQMKDPWSGEEARELWNGVQQARQEAAAYRAAFATPEDAHALKELYPGGVNEARATTERARVLDDFDRAYFGTAGKSAQEVSASRAQLAQTMLREDPAAFREMVFAGQRALEDLGKRSGENTVAQALRPEGVSSSVSAAPTDRKSLTPEGVSYSDQHAASLAAYASFEKATNDDLERSVGATIERTLLQALPNASRVSNASGVGAHAAPLQARLSAAIRQDVEAALKGDRQLSEQVAQILSGRRLDNEARVQVVRLIGERAQQLVPVAAKRVLNDWTQTTLAAHRNQTARVDAASTRREVASASSDSRGASSSGDPSISSGRARSQDANRAPARSDSRRVDYRKLSDEQILDL